MNSASELLGVANAAWPVEPSVMLLPGRVEGWPAGTQRAANAAERLLSQAVAWWDVGQYRDGDRFLRNRGTGGELLDLRLGSALAPNSNDPLFLPVEDQGYAYLPGVGSNFLSVPDEAALDITGDIDLRARIALDDWTSSAQAVISKYTTTGNQRSYILYVSGTGALVLDWSADGTTSIVKTSTAVLTASDGNPLWVRATLDVNNGAAGNDVKFWTSDDGSIWTQLGATVTTAGTTSIYTSTTPVLVGLWGVAGLPLSGKVYRAQVLNGIDGTTVLDIDCDAITSGSATTFTALTGQTVTINRATSGRKSVAVPPRSRGGQPVMLLGTDDYLEVQDNWQHGLLNFGQGDSFTVLAVVRQWATASFAALVSKGSGLAAANVGWTLYANAATAGLYLGDGTAEVAETQALTLGALSTIAGVRSVAADTAATYVNGVSTAPTTDTTTRTSNAVALRVGRLGGAGNYADVEFAAAAIFRRALTPAEITALSNYFTGRIA